ncbi:MAG: hypothetical protein IJ600_09115, partial [Lachnospiraceae bacterium]|nr:hypothetical protein [Lachnospiraceae bacterium]
MAEMRNCQNPGGSEQLHHFFQTAANDRNGSFAAFLSVKQEAAQAGKQSFPFFLTGGVLVVG